MIPITRRIALDEREIDESFARASGPGGLNVNTLSTSQLDATTAKRWRSGVGA